MKPVRQDRITVQLKPKDGNAPALADILETFKTERLGFEKIAVNQNVLSMSWKTPAYEIGAELETDAANPQLVNWIYLFTSVDQPNLAATANALNLAKCKLSQNHSLIIYGDETAYICHSCSKCESCDRLLLRLQKRHAAAEASRRALKWINSYSERRDEFIAALPEIES